MAAALIPALGSKWGPCAIPCQHLDCQEIHRMAKTPCKRCGEILGYDVRYYENEGLVHADCEKLAAEEETKQRWS